jgi:hypothetical protein
MREVWDDTRVYWPVEAAADFFSWWWLQRMERRREEPQSIEMPKSDQRFACRHLALSPQSFSCSTILLYPITLESPSSSRCPHCINTCILVHEHFHAHITHVLRKSGHKKPLSHITAGCSLEPVTDWRSPVKHDRHFGKQLEVRPAI